MSEPVTSPNELIKIMMKSPHHWWCPEELSEHAGVFVPVCKYFLNELRVRHLVIRRKGHMTGKSYYRIKTEWD